MELINRTPFAAQHVITIDRTGRETLLAVVRATFSLAADMRTTDEQPPLVPADEYHGEPGASSVKCASDFILSKPNTDIILTGYAYPDSRDDRSVDVSLKFATLEKTVRVFGDRAWQKRGGKFRLTEPQAFDRMPLVYERAYGGVDESEGGSSAWWRENPVGCGFCRPGSQNADGLAAPNLVAPTSTYDDPFGSQQTSCFSWVAPNWEPRVSYAGTYDEEWRENTMPLLPNDFNYLYYQAAPADQVYPGYIRGEETVRVSGVSPTQLLEFTVPRVSLEAAVTLGDDLLTPDLQCDTVIIDAAQLQLTLIWRTVVDLHGRTSEFFWVAIEGEVL